MNFTIEHKKAFTVIGISTHIEPDEGYIKCPQFWDTEYNERYSHLWQTMKPENEEEQAIFYNKNGQAFLPNGSTTVEYYTMGDQTSDDYECGIWIPVIGK